MRACLRRLRLATALLVAVAACAPAAEKPTAAGGMSCEQLVAVVQTAIDMRDQGLSLQRVLAELKPVEAEGKLSVDDMVVLRKSVTAAYLGNASVDEIALACKEARGRRR